MATTIYRAHRGNLRFLAETLSPEQARTFEHCCNVFGHLIRLGEEVSFSEWADRIERTYTPGARLDACLAAVRAAGGVRSYWLSVFWPFECDQDRRVAMRHEVLRVDTPGSLQWMREHADEIAEKHGGPGYVALMVNEAPPPVSSTEQRIDAPAAA